MDKHCFANSLDKITVGGLSTADIPFDLYKCIIYNIGVLFISMSFIHRFEQ